MALTWVWVGMVCIALIFGAATGQSAAVGAAAAQGVQQAVTFCLTVGGMICLWSGVMEVMRRSGIAAGLSRLLQPVLRQAFVVRKTVMFANRRAARHPLRRL